MSNTAGGNSSASTQQTVPGHVATSYMGRGAAATRRSKVDKKKSCGQQQPLPVFLLGVINPIMLKALDRYSQTQTVTADDDP